MVFLPLLCIFLWGNVLGASQQVKISLNLKEVSIVQFFKEIEARTAFKFFYKDSQVEKAPSVTIVVTDQSLENVLKTAFEKTNLTYEITGNQIVIKLKNENSNTRIITGTVTDKNLVPLAGVSIMLVGTKKGTFSDEEGKFEITIPRTRGVAINISMIGMNTQILYPDDKTFYQIVMEEDRLQLSEAVVTGYQTLPKERVTGAFTTLDSKILETTGSFQSEGQT
jgi:TonB-dependent starch-binding outer membrane protein SusC